MLQTLLDWISKVVEEAQLTKQFMAVCRKNREKKNKDPCEDFKL